MTILNLEDSRKTKKIVVLALAFRL